MIPARLVQVERIPLTPQGKADRAALAALAAPALRDGAGPVPPRTPLEGQLLAIWREVLGRPDLGVEDGFFEAGGHSLNAMHITTRAQKALGRPVTLADLFNAGTVAALAARLSRAADAPAPIPALAEAPDYPASHAQSRLWLLLRLGGDPAAYNIAGAVRLRGALDRTALDRAWTLLVERHAALRTCFVERGGLLRQRILPATPVSVPVEEFAGPAAEADALARLTAIAARPLAVETTGPLHLTLLRLAPDDHILVHVVHHLVTDGWSADILAAEFMQAYAAACRGEVAALAPLPVRYADVAAWEAATADSPERAATAAWWTARFREPPPALPLPTDHPRPARQSWRGATHRFHLPADLAVGLDGLARRQGVSRFAILAAAVSLLLHRHTGETDICLGHPVAGRSHPDMAGLVGLFVNTLALRTPVDPAAGFAALAAGVGAVVQDSLARQDFPFDRLVEAVLPERRLDRHPLFDVLLLHRSADDGTVAAGLPGLTVEPVPCDNGTAKFDLTFGFQERADGGIDGLIEYATDLFLPASAARLADHLARLLQGGLAAPDTPVGLLPLLSPAEQDLLMGRWNRPRHLPAAAPVHQDFHAVAARTPDATALIAPAADGGLDRMTYGRLAALANGLAHRLRAAGVGRGDRVALLLRRSMDQVVGILATLTAGAAYVPIDPDLPPARQSFIMADCGARAIITHAAAAGSAADEAGLPLFDLDRLDNPTDGGPGLAVTVGPQDPAYLIYTSGSTGQPKGVVVSHGNLSRLMPACADWMQPAPDDVFCLFHTYGFDVSVWELWAALLHGASALVVPAAVAWSAPDLLALVRRAGVTVLNQTPSALRRLIAAEGEAPDGPALRLRAIISAGEELDPESLRPWFARHGDGTDGRGPAIINAYGPTEATVYTHWYRVTTADLDTPDRPIGIPLLDMRGHILDERMQPLPVGCVGQLWLGGDGVAQGYHNRPELTQAAFIPDPFHPEPGAMLYRTGDLARFRPDGAVLYLGRRDGQVKIRGFRVELGEIESRLRGLPGVTDAIVMPRPIAGVTELVAWVEGKGLAEETLRAALRQVLPAYMVPARILLLAALPLNANGKVDRRRLPDPEADAAATSGTGAAPPRTALEARLCAVWAEVLGRQTVGIHDNFFELGGHSLAAARIVARLKEEDGRTVPLASLFTQPTIAALAGALETLAADAAPDNRAADAALAELAGELEGLDPAALDALLAETEGSHG